MSIFLKEFQSYSELQGYCGGTASPGLYFVKVDETKDNLPTQYYFNGTTIVNISGSSKSKDVELTNEFGNFSASSTVEDALNELFQNVNDGKQVVATAIVDKGGNVTVANTFAELAAAIKNIQTTNSALLEKNEVVLENLEMNSITYIQLQSSNITPENLVISVYKFIPSSLGTTIKVESFNFENSFEIKNIDKDIFNVDDGVVKMNDFSQLKSTETEIIDGQTLYRFNIDFTKYSEILTIE